MGEWDNIARQLDGNRSTNQQSASNQWTNVASQLGVELAPQRENTPSTGEANVPLGVARAAANGLLFNFGDELEAGVRTLGGLNGNYGETLQGIRDENRQFRNENQALATGAEIGGGLAGILVPGGAIARGLGTVSRVAGGGIRGGLASGALAGAGSSALSGFGEGEGGIGNRLQSAADQAPTGAAVGGVLGGAIGGLLPAARRVGVGVPTDEIAARQAADALNGVGDARVNRINRVDSNPFDDAIGQIDREAGRRSGPLTPGEYVGPTGNQVDAILQSASNNATRGADDAIARLRNRPIGAAERVIGLFDDAFDRPMSFADLEAANRAAEAAADPLYAAARSAGYISDPTLSSFVQRLPPQVFREVSQNARLAGIDPIPLVDRNGQLTRTPRADELIAIRDATQDLVNRQFREGLGNSARQLKNALNQYTALLDSILPTFKQARQTFAGPAALQSALEAGRDALRMNPDQLRGVIRGYTNGELESFKSGFIDAVRNRLGDVRDGNNAAVFGKNSNDRGRISSLLSALYGKDMGRARANRLFGGLDDEDRIQKATNRTFNNSQTSSNITNQANRKLDDVFNSNDALRGIGIGALFDPTAGLGAAAASTAVRWAMRNKTANRNADREGALINILGGTGRDGAVRGLERGREAYNRYNARLARDATAGAGIARTSQGISGLLYDPQDRNRDPNQPRGLLAR